MEIIINFLIYFDSLFQEYCQQQGWADAYPTPGQSPPRREVEGSSNDKVKMGVQKDPTQPETRHQKDMM